MEVRELAKQHLGDDEPEHRIAKELQRLVVGDAAARVFLGAGLVRERMFQQPAVAEPVSEAPLQRLELVADGDHGRAIGVRPVRLDKPCRLGRLVGRHGNAHLPQAFHADREHRWRALQRAHDRDAVRLQQAGDNARLDIRVGTEDDGPVAGHASTAW